ncbi:hypothetical protein L1887_24927 [Cichorium endivia]|nr:hypothetical protein L1887_24927 [Cichorium endivia]
MGTCASCYSRSTATNAATAKVILLDGQLREYSSPMKVFLVAPLLDDLGDEQCSFICNADEMNFGEYLTAMTGEEELHPSQLYFQLPASWLKRRLATEDMASLAVKAGRALMIGGAGKVRCWFCVKRVDPLLFSDGDEVLTSSWSRVGGGGGDGSYDGNQSHGGGRVGGGRRGGGKGPMSTRLAKITEE